MKRLLLTLLTLLILFPFQGHCSSLMSMMGGGFGYTFYCGDYIVCQNFETATTGYDNGETWTTHTAGDGTITPTYATSPAPLRGTQSLDLNSGTTGGLIYAYTTYTAQDTVYVRLIYRPVAVTTNALTYMIFIADSTLTYYAMVRLVFVSPGVYQFRISDETKSASTGNISDFTSHTYYIWLKVAKGTGTNAVYELSYTVDSNTKPENPQLSITDGVLTHQLATVMPVSGANGWNNIFDQVLIKTTAIGSGDLP